MGIIDDLKWRYATKKFDPTKKVPDEDVEIIKESIRLAASSYGLQLYRIMIVTDPKLKKQLRAASWNQGQLEDASHVFVFCYYNEVTERLIDDMIELRAKASSTPVESHHGYRNFLISMVANMPEQERVSWLAKQNYIALGKAMAACGNLRIDSCPIEGFEVDKYDEILGLKERGLTACVVLPVGYRAKDDPIQYFPKSRRSMEALFEEL